MKLPVRRPTLALLLLALVISPAVRVCADEATHPAPNASAPYSPEGLKHAFAELCARLHYNPLRVEVDQSGSPFLVYGILEGRCDYREIRDALGSMPGYAYSGSVVAVSRDGARTVFALNMIPHTRTDMERMKQLAKSLQL